MLQSSNSPNRSPNTVEMHQVQFVDTVDHISVNKQRHSNGKILEVSGEKQHKFP